MSDFRLVRIHNNDLVTMASLMKAGIGSVINGPQADDLMNAYVRVRDAAIMAVDADVLDVPQAANENEDQADGGERGDAG